MKEIAAVLKGVLEDIQPAMIEKKGVTKPSRAKYVLSSAVRDEARVRVQALLDRHVLYPSLDLDFLTKHFG